MNRFNKFITKGINEPLTKLPFHKSAPIERFLMLNNELMPNCNTHIAVHFIKNLPDKIEPYSELHQHNFDEINLVLSDNDTLVYRIKLEDETYEVSSPSSIFIPKGTTHSAEVVSGTGVFVCIGLTNKYVSSK